MSKVMVNIDAHIKGTNCSFSSFTDCMPLIEAYSCTFHFLQIKYDIILQLLFIFIHLYMQSLGKKIPQVRHQ